MAVILVVEDDESVRSVLNELFMREHVCHGAETAEQALSLMETNDYDVIVADIFMPGMSGTELLGFIRYHHPDTPTILISGTDDRDYAENLIRMGAFRYLMKPFQLTEIEESVAGALDYREQRLQEKKRYLSILQNKSREGSST